MSQNGKGDKVRPFNKKIYDENFSQINWHRNDDKSLDKLKQKDDNYDILKHDFMRSMTDEEKKIADEFFLSHYIKQQTK